MKYFIGNWKMFGDFTSIKIINRVNIFAKRLKRVNKKNKIIFCIPYTLIHIFSSKFKNNLINLGAQNCHEQRGHGAFTGSVSASMLRKSGAKYVILGHSENRKSGETNKQIKNKIDSALKEKINVIFCIGESLQDKKKGKTFSVLKKQIKDSISRKFKLDKIIIAYEPIWSIGTGKIPKPQDLEKIFIFIKTNFKLHFKTKKFPKVLYGGSVNGKNVKMFSFISEIDGFLIGGASQSSKKFIDIMKNYYK